MKHMMYGSAKSSDEMGEVVMEVNPQDSYDLRMFVMVCHDNARQELPNGFISGTRLRKRNW